MAIPIQALSQPNQGNGSFAGLLPTVQTPQLPALPMGRTVFKGGSECQLQQHSPQKRGDLNGP